VTVFLAKIFGDIRPHSPSEKYVFPPRFEEIPPLFKKKEKKREGYWLYSNPK